MPSVLVVGESWFTYTVQQVRQKGFDAFHTAAFTSDVAPHWAPPPFLAGEGYAELWDRLVPWLAGSEL
ncbi:glutamine amidotransferase [Streptomyces albicerus]|uniref:glutamine amidotransferase n=1 Tax=Streptomyces albicerus TaxID=2569859 RepID=UPI00124B49FD|nr:glutamine amidotransferase [Streptomyces albicerus]